MPAAEDEEAFPLARDLERPLPDFWMFVAVIVTNSDTDNWKPRVVCSAMRSLTLASNLESKRTSEKGDEAQKSRFLYLSGTDDTSDARYRSFLAETNAWVNQSENFDCSTAWIERAVMSFLKRGGSRGL